MAQPAANAEETLPQPRFPTTEFAEGAKSASVTLGDLTATITMVRRPDIDPGADVPVLNVTVGGVNVLEAPGVSSGFSFPAAEASIAEIDPDNRHPEVFFSSYSGGAHCCSTVIVAAELAGGWTAVPVGDFDGDGDYLHDLDNDGLAEIATVDNRFLYRFDCYACSAAPLAIYTVRGGEVLDVSAEQDYLAAHRDWLAQIEDAVDPAERWTSPGYLAGWLAQKVRVREGPAAWADINAHWNFGADAGEEVCLSGGQPEDCPRRNLKVLSFPERLKLFLDETGYRF
jgi:hypothetical protein